MITKAASMPRVLVVVFGVAVAACARPAPTPVRLVSSTPAASVSISRAPSSTPSETKDDGKPWVIIGGIEVDRVPGVSVDPVFDKAAAEDVVAAELTAGRAKMIGRHQDAPPMFVVEAAFVPALVRILGPAGTPDYEPAEPVAAWVVVSEGRGSDGTYISVGVVGQDGAPLATYVFTPGYG